MGAMICKIAAVILLALGIASCANERRIAQAKDDYVTCLRQNPDNPKACESKRLIAQTLCGSFECVPKPDRTIVLEDR
jgi:hypothetical protein